MGSIKALVFYFLVPLGAMALSPNSTSQSVPSFVNIGALFTFDSIIGRVVKTAIQAAVDDVNADSNMLPRTKMNVVIQDTNCSGFLGIMEGMSGFLFSSTGYLS